MNRWNSKTNKSAWDWCIEDMKRHGYSDTDIEAMRVKMLSHPDLKTKSKRLSDNYRTAFYAGVLYGIRTADEMLDTISPS